MDLLVTITLMLFTGISAGGDSDIQIQEPSGYSSQGSSFFLMQHLFKLECKIETQLNQMEEDVEELKSKGINWPQECSSMREDITEMKSDIDQILDTNSVLKQKLTVLQDGISELQTAVSRKQSPAHNPNTCTNSHYTLVPSLKLCYHIYKNNPMTWEAAKNFCASQSARLLILKDAATENYFIHQHFYDTDSNHRYWLGGNDFANRHSFLWLNGQHLGSHLVWAPGEPNNYYNHERCLDFLYGYGRLGLNDDDCSKHLYFICEEPLP